MNKKEIYVAAIDIGTTKIVAIVGAKKKMNTLRFSARKASSKAAVKRGVVLNIEETVNAIQTTVEQVQGRPGVMF